MTRKKQIIVPIAIIAAGALLFILFSNMKKPPEEKEKIDTTPIVSVQPVAIGPMVLEVNSYGIVTPKYETELVAQVSGPIVELSQTFERGGFVAKGQLLARIDPSDYEAALIDAQANLASARASLEKERAQGKVAEQEWKEITDTSPTELSLRKPQLAQEIARVKAAQASVLRAKRNMERTEIRAPYDAMIENRNIGLGSFVGTGSMVGKLLGTAIAEVRLPVADGELQFLAEQGKDASVVLIGDFAGQEIEWQAKVIRSEGVVDAKSRMSYFVAQVQDPYGLIDEKKHEIPLRFGAYVNAKIKGIELTSATIVPRYLVVDDKIATLDQDNKLQFVAIDIVRQVGRDVIVASGLNEGDQVITSALDYPVNGMKLALPDDEEGDLPKTDETQLASIKD
ncbi:efflux RND transporter periplasmic adaptor subunit [Thalassotalea piscium]|uniref:RND family efflux transporter MFP subunit n=1 Tax=Thalassotalea piscium TaxID=1230533 RepID=A0A7X0NI41_9GAMM|nr:efflux RND transporter periplasmic adaptor subunit [Thalassotalea piscium]MBB6543873.1 RND family efflux transporter MFP subunit [Thalassotalea piscium]